MSSGILQVLIGFESLKGMYVLYTAAVSLPCCLPRIPSTPTQPSCFIHMTCHKKQPAFIVTSLLIMYSRRRRISKGRTMRWAKETTLVAQPLTVTAGGTGNFIAVPSIPGQGNRKVRGISVKITSTFNWPMPIALVFVPSGTAPQAIGSGSVATFGSKGVEGEVSSLYEPNQNVLAVSQIPAKSSETLTLFYSGTRNLGSGDSICCVYKNFSDQGNTGNILITVSYLIGY